MIKHIGIGVNAKVANDFIKQIPIDDLRMRDETPFYFKIVMHNKELERELNQYKILYDNSLSKKDKRIYKKKIDEKKKILETTCKTLYFEVKQISCNKFDKLHYYIFKLCEFYENYKENGYVKEMDNLLIYFCSFIELLNPTEILNPSLLKIKNTEYRFELEDEDYKNLFMEFMKYDLLNRRAYIYLRTMKYKDVMKMFNEKILGMWKECSFKYIKDLADEIITNAIKETIGSLSINELSKPIEAVIKYNNADVKKNFQLMKTAKEKNTVVCGKKKYSLSEKVTLVNHGGILSLEIR